jgi:hypothetical protein
MAITLCPVLQATVEDITTLLHRWASCFKSSGYALCPSFDLETWWDLSCSALWSCQLRYWRMDALRHKRANSTDTYHANTVEAKLQSL